MSYGVKRPKDKWTWVLEEEEAHKHLKVGFSGSLSGGFMLIQPSSLMTMGLTSVPRPIAQIRSFADEHRHSTLPTRTVKVHLSIQ
jgi:hypothetical protein